MMIDEVQCGMGRTGKWFAHQWADIQPDVMPLARGLGSGVPVGAVGAPKAANNVLPRQPRQHLRRQPAGHARRGETIRIMEEEGLLANADAVGRHLNNPEKAALPNWPPVAGRQECAAGPDAGH